jgi:hypothetical protein
MAQIPCWDLEVGIKTHFDFLPCVDIVYEVTLPYNAIIDSGMKNHKGLV